MQVKTVSRLGIVMTTMLGAVSLVAQTEFWLSSNQNGEMASMTGTRFFGNWKTMECEAPSKADVPPNADKHGWSARL